ncbi:MAG: FAD:protein FMN transferase [Gammaproteobacteria bacterium]|nr:FAD:protein FMN transferase [Gammaproteobacteria bacterium]
MRLRQGLVAAAVVAGLAYLALRTPDPTPAQPSPVHRRDFLAMGTLVSISAYRGDAVSPEQAEQALGDAERSLLDFEHRWSAWGEGELGRINRKLAAGDTVGIPPDMQDLFGLAMEQTRKSRGLFDARIGNLVWLWGFDDESRYRSEPPPAAEVQAALAPLRGAREFEPGKPYGPAPGVAWDFGAIAKGYAVEQAVAQLKRAGLPDVIVNAGGNLRAVGRHGDRPWRVGIRHPRAKSPGEVLAALNTDGDEAVLTSGDYERYFEHGGRRYHHILDPRSGEPARGFQSVTVVTRDAALADAASTALFVAGPEHWRDIAARLGTDRLLLVDAEGRVAVTRALAPRLEFAPGIQYQVVE